MNDRMYDIKSSFTNKGKDMMGMGKKTNFANRRKIPSSVAYNVLGDFDRLS